MAVQIIFIRENFADDVITIRKRHHRPDFLVRYVDGTQPNKVWLNDKNISSLMEYIDNVLTNFMNDADPFKFVQVTIPGMPIIYYRHADVNELTVSDIMGSIYDVLVNPPTSFFQ
jgi:hypothetical protein